MVDALNSLSAAWWSWLAPISVQVAVLAALVWLVDLPLRRRGWPQVRYALWGVVFLRLLLPPGLALPTSIPSRILASLRSAEPQAAAAPAAAPSAPSAPIVAVTPPAPSDIVPAAPAAPVPAPRPTLKTVAMLVWLAMSLLLLSLLVRKALSIRRSLAAASAPPDWLRDVAAEVAAALHMKRSPRVLLCDFIRSAAVFGPVRPVILLPSTWTTEYTREQLFHILLHESAHIRRGDLAANAGQALLHIAFWFHPFVWLAGGRARELRELCCDVKVSLVLGQGRTSMYRETLIAVARKVIAPAVGLSLGLLGLFESPSGFAARLEHLAGRPFSFPRLRLAAAVLAAAMVALAILPMAAAQLPADGGGASGVTASPARATGRLEVCVYNADTKVGVAGLYAGISRPSDQPPRILENVKTEGAGFAHTDLVPGEYKVGVYPRLRVREFVETSVQIVAGRTQRVQLAVVPTGVLSGVISDEAGQPVEGATAWFSQVSSGKPTSDREGRFEAIADLEVDPHRPVLFAAQSLERRLVAAGEFDPSQPSLAITLRRAASARGRILDDDGAPIEHADVQAREIFRDVPGQGAWGIGFGAEPTDSTGRYVIPCLPAVIGIHISAKAEGYGGTSVVLPMNDTEGTIVEAPDIRLPAAAESVSGVVVDAEGRPVAGAKVIANGVGVQKLIDADENGRFKVNGLMKGSVRLHVFTLGPAPVASEPREFQTGDQDVRLVAIPVAPAT